MTTRKKIIIGFIVIIVFIASTFVVIKGFTKSVSSETKNVENKTNTDVFNEYVNNNNVVDNNKIEDSNVEENNIVDNKTEEDNTNTTEEQIIGKEEEETQEEIKNEEVSKQNNITEAKAKQLVEQVWGQDDTVYYTVANKDEINYYISVNDNSTTSVLAWYTVNIKTGEVTEN